MAELGANHHWDFPDLDLVTLVQGLLTDHRSHTLFVGFPLLELLDFDRNVNFSLVGQIAQPSLVRQYGFIYAVLLKVTGELVYSDIAKVNAVNGVLVVLTKELALLDDVLGLELLDDFLYTVL